MIFPGGHVWFFPRGVCVGYDKIQSMSGRYASYWNAFLLITNVFCKDQMVRMTECLVHKYAFQ